MAVIPSGPVRLLGEDCNDAAPVAILLRPEATPVFVASRILLMKFDFFGFTPLGCTRPPTAAIPSSLNPACEGGLIADVEWLGW
jgi:hypothetical protein